MFKDIKNWAIELTEIVYIYSVSTALLSLLAQPLIRPHHLLIRFLCFKCLEE
jgi:hypothetical protein